MHKLADGLVMCSFCKSLFPLSRLSPKPVWIFFPYLGPSNWSGICSTGKRQSPIDIKSTEVTFDKGLGEFTLKNYDRKLNKTFTGSNTGYAFGLSFPAGVYNVSGGGLNGVYTTVQFHLHYGPNDTVGSEHIVDGEHYAAEVSACEQISAFTLLLPLSFCHQAFSLQFIFYATLFPSFAPTNILRDSAHLL